MAQADITRQSKISLGLILALVGVLVGIGVSSAKLAFFAGGDRAAVTTAVEAHAAAIERHDAAIQKLTQQITVLETRSEYQTEALRRLEHHFGTGPPKNP